MVKGKRRARIKVGVYRKEHEICATFRAIFIHRLLGFSSPLLRLIFFSGCCEYSSLQRRIVFKLFFQSHNSFFLGAFERFNILSLFFILFCSFSIRLLARASCSLGKVPLSPFSIIFYTRKLRNQLKRE